MLQFLELWARKSLVPSMSKTYFTCVTISMDCHYIVLSNLQASILDDGTVLERLHAEEMNNRLSEDKSLRSTRTAKSKAAAQLVIFGNIGLSLRKHSATRSRINIEYNLVYTDP